MAGLPESMVALMSALGKLPGVGPRSAERMALQLVQGEQDVARNLAHAILAAREKIRSCSRCGALTESETCAICLDERRDTGLICIVERAVDILNLEKAGAFRGRYHVLGGKISPLNGVEPEDLRIAQLESRLTTETIREIVIALPLDVEGDATSYYLAKRLARAELVITRIAHGLPAGSALEFADDLTLTRAMQGRREMT